MGDKTAFHPSGLEIKFNEEKHSYIDSNGNVYESVTTFIGRFFDKFDMDAMSKKCSEGQNPKYSGRVPEEIKSEWQAEGDRGRTEGTNTHELAEGLMEDWPHDQLPEPISPRCERIFDQVQKAVSYLKNRYILIGAELIVFDPETLKAGMIDLLMFDPESMSVLILDWKQNKQITLINTYQSAKKPIEYLMDTDKNHYALQLSMYQYMLKKGGYIKESKKYKRAIIHLTEDNYKIMWLEDMEFEIKEMLNYEN